jgi:hypothetical protein
MGGGGQKNFITKFFNFLTKNNDYVFEVSQEYTITHIGYCDEPHNFFLKKNKNSKNLKKNVFGPPPLPRIYSTFGLVKNIFTERIFSKKNNI